jgi:dipeptidyl aminopeptidase/acylaminoacyl peptidase
MSLLKTLLRPVALGLLLAGGVQAQTPAAAPPPARAFFAPSEFNEVELSPSGTHLAVTTAKLNGRRTLYVFDLAGGTPPTQAARIEGLDVVRVNWINDKRLVFSVVNLSLGSGSRNHEPGGLFAVDRDGENMRTLIRRTASETGGAGGRANERSLSWDHGLLAIPAFVPGERNDTVVVGHQRVNAKGEIASVRPLHLNVNSGVVRAVEDLNAPPGASEWLLDPNGVPRVAVTVDELHGVIHYRAPGSSEWQRIGEGNLLDLPFTPRFVDNDGTLYVGERRGKDGTAVLTRFDFKIGKPEREALVSTPGFDFEGSLLTQRKGNALGLQVITDALQTVWFDPAMKAFQAKVDGLLPGRVNTVSCARCGADDMVALVSSSSDREPGEYLIYRAKGDQWQRVGRARPEIKPEQMGRMDFQRIKARDGLDLPIWLTYPAGVKPGVTPAKPLPTVVLVHGGPNARGAVWGWNSYAGYTQFLASRGYLVIEPEFRGSEGFGKRHLEAGYKQWGEGMQDDIADALLWAQKQGIASDKACIAGASYGGYATFAGLMRHPGLYRCGVAWVAVTDLMLLAQGSAWVDTDIGVLSRTEILSKRLGDPVADAAMLRATSPVENADKIKAPVLLSMGMADRRVPIAHGNRMRDAMQKVGNPMEYVTYQDEGHSYLMTDTLLDWAGRMERFLAKHLGQP